MSASPSRFLLGVLLALAGCTATPSSPPAARSAGAVQSITADLAEARRLTLARDFLAANPHYERCIAADPANGEVRYLYGLSLSLEAGIDPGTEAARATRKKARQQLLAARERGSTEPLLDRLLDNLAPDGSPPPPDTLSVDRQTNAVMQAAEKAYQKGDFAQAANLQQQALTLEPGNYLAALYCGDAYFAQKDYEAAGNWFARAVAINPDIETAHRYWADALAHQRKFEEATARYIDAVVAEPYNQLTRTRFAQYAASVGLPLRTGLLPRLTAQVVSREDKIEISLPADQDGYTAVLNLSYAAACAKFRTEDFGRLYPNETKPRRSLPEEVDGLRGLLQVAGNLGADSDKAKPEDVARWRSALETLGRIQDEGLLEAFALLERPDQDLARDYASYREAHRDKLVRFIRIFWCGLN